MTALITVADLREHVETDLPDAALQRIIGDADAAITERFGGHGEGGATISEEIHPSPLSPLLFPARPVSSVESITEHQGPLFDEETVTVLAADDYRVELGGRAIRRLSSGTNAATVWGERVELVYTPVVDGWRRARVTVDLCKLTIAYNALKHEGAGDYRADSLDYQRERERILGELARAGGIVFA